MRFIHFLSAGPGSVWMPLADAMVKATVLFAAAGGMSFLLRRRSAAARHMVWTLALVGALLLPALSIALPRWQLPLVTVTGASLPEASGFQLPAASSESSIRSSACPAASSPSRVLSTEPLVSSQSPVSRSELAPSSFRFPALPLVSWPVALLLLWLIGACAILGRVAAGLLIVQWMSRRSEHATDAAWLPVAKQLAREIGVSPRTVFLRSGRAAMPMACGIVRPAVLIPSEADTWPAGRLRIVLLHELAHVKRRDCLTHMFAQLACAFYWFNPLAWIAARHVRTERERACDDLVLAAGTPGADYADQLLQVARVMRSERFPGLLAGASLAMAHRSQLEGRLMAILDPSVPRSTVSRLRAVSATALFACAMIPLASLQPWAYTAQPVTAADSRVDGQMAAHVAGPAERQAVGDVAGQHPEIAELEAMTSTLLEGAESLVEAASAGVVQDVVESAIEAAAESVVHSRIDSTTQRAVEAAVASTEVAVQAALSGLDEHAKSWHIAANPDWDDAAQDSSKGKSAADPRTIAALTAALKDTDKEVRETALHALVQMRDPGIFAPLVQALSDSSAEVRQQAAFGLGQMRDRRAVEPLIGALKDQVAEVRQQAVFALGQLRDRTAVPALTTALKDSDDEVREQAVFALGQLRDPAALDALVLAARDAKPDVRQQAVFALGQLRDRRAVEALVSALKDADADVRQQAAFGLGQIRDRAAVEALVIALKDSVPDVRQQVAFALGQLGDARAIDALTTALKDASAEVRRQAAFALGQLAR